MPQSFSGGCLCGAVRYACDAEPMVATYCQCRDCQRDTGAGHSAHVGIPRAALRLEGELRIYESGAASGNVARRSFCPRCGSSVLFETSGFPDAVFVSAGSLDDPSVFRPAMVVFASSAQPWDLIDPTLPRFEGMPRN